MEKPSKRIKQVEKDLRRSLSQIKYAPNEISIPDEITINSVLIKNILAILDELWEKQNHKK